MSQQVYIPLNNGNKIFLSELDGTSALVNKGTVFLKEWFPSGETDGTLYLTTFNRKLYYKQTFKLKTGYTLLCTSVYYYGIPRWDYGFLCFLDPNDNLYYIDASTMPLCLFLGCSTNDYDYNIGYINTKTLTPATFTTHTTNDWGKSCIYTAGVNTLLNYGYLTNVPLITESVGSTNAYHVLWDTDTPPLFDPASPLDAGGNSTTGGGSGSFDLTSEAVDFQAPPSLSAVSAGFISLYAPTLAQLNSLASYMWSQTFIDAILKLFSDPMQAILGLSIVPVTVPVGAAENIKVGFVDTGVSCNKAVSQYVTFDCGTLTPAEYWGSALDYSPYTKFTIFLPFIGAREIDTIDIMGKSIQVKYNIDILSGSCTAMIKCGDAVKYQYSGSCASSIPVTGRDFTNLLTSAIQLASIAGTTVATGGASAAGLVSATANAVAAMRPNVQRGSAVSGSAGLLGIQKPFLIWELPKQSLAKDYNKFMGYPSNITALLSSLSGFTQIEDIRLTSISATDDEKAEIETLLKEGVIL